MNVGRAPEGVVLRFYSIVECSNALDYNAPWFVESIAFALVPTLCSVPCGRLELDDAGERNG